MLGDKEIAEIKGRNNIDRVAVERGFNYDSNHAHQAWANTVEDISALLAHYAELQAEVERLQKYNNEENEECIRGLNVLYADLKDERDRLRVEIERLNEAAKRGLSYGAQVTIDYHIKRSDKYAERADRLQAENDALKRAAIGYVRKALKLEQDGYECNYNICCYSCKHVETNEDTCDSCDDNFSGWELDFDRFKDGGECHD